MIATSLSATEISPPTVSASVPLSPETPLTAQTVPELQKWLDEQIKTVHGQQQALAQALDEIKNGDFLGLSSILSRLGVIEQLIIPLPNATKPKTTTRAAPKSKAIVPAPAPAAPEPAPESIDLTQTLLPADAPEAATEDVQLPQPFDAPSAEIKGKAAITVRLWSRHVWAYEPQLFRGYVSQAMITTMAGTASILKKTGLERRYSEGTYLWSNLFSLDQKKALHNKYDDWKRVFRQGEQAPQFQPGP
jgi:hypothetical protein